LAEPPAEGVEEGCCRAEVATVLPVGDTKPLREEVEEVVEER
jgi:hypothetical protein